ncbi:MAG: peptidylprolyl isomerase [Myxococcota bacterium]|nr:peptidylprolyl isomerase [Myxococcota bacterium]
MCGLRILRTGFFTAITLLVGSGVGFAGEVIDRVVAVIEDHMITLRELEAKAGPYFNELSKELTPAARAAQEKVILSKILDIEIGEKIVDAELKKSRERLRVGEEDIDRAVQEIMRMNNLDREQLQAALYGQGMTWAEYRKKLRLQIERSRLIQANVSGNVEVKAQEVRQTCLDSQKTIVKEPLVCAAHILLRVPDKDSAQLVKETHARALALQSELRSGADFSAYALKYSDDKSTPDGDLGCFGKGEMVGEFELVALSTSVGEISEVVKTMFGFHIIKVRDRKIPQGSNCISEAELAPYKNKLQQKKFEEEMGRWVKKLRNKLYVEVRL